MLGIETTSISSKGQITIPLRIRKAFKIGAGQKFAFSERKDGILLKPVDVSVKDKTETDEWAIGLKQALADVKAGRTTGPMTGEEFLALLNKTAAEGKSKPARSRAKRPRA
jgi:AbrB family looped-hinge helix DNA binding protein